jgi:hypothetical protein
MWTNQTSPHRYGPPTPAAVGTNHASPSAGGTDQPRRSILASGRARAVSSTPPGSTDRGTVATEVGRGRC